MQIPHNYEAYKRQKLCYIDVQFKIKSNLTSQIQHPHLKCNCGYGFARFQLPID